MRKKFRLSIVNRVIKKKKVNWELVICYTFIVVWCLVLVDMCFRVYN